MNKLVIFLVTFIAVAFLMMASKYLIEAVPSSFNWVISAVGIVMLGIIALTPSKRGRF